MKRVTSLLTAYLLLISTNSFSQAGSLDSSFGKDGIVEAQFERSSRGNAVALQSDGKIIVAGNTYNGRNDDFALTRYHPDGTLDSSFGVSGQIVTGFGGNDAAFSIAIQADGKILSAGLQHNSHARTDADFALVRYKQNGKRDIYFGENGKVGTDFGAEEIGYSVAIQPNSKILVAGKTGSGSYSNFALARYNQNGQPDSAFGNNGKVTTDFGSWDEGHSLAIQPDGKILVTGFAYNELNSDFALARYKSNGDPDSAFGTNGKVLTDFGGFDQGNSVSIQADGKIVVAGMAHNGSNNDFALARYQPNGNLDSVFGINGKVVTDIGDADFGTSVAIQADGKIVVAGGSGKTSRYHFALLRYRHNGKLDNTFGIKGIVITDDPESNDEAAESLAIQPDGKIVIAGYAGGNYAILRYNGDNISVASTSSNNLSNFKKQNNIISTIHLSPNPVKDILRIENLSSATKTISIIDAKGKLLQQAASASNNYSFNIKKFSAGIYFVRINEGDKTSTLKFIKE